MVAFPRAMPALVALVILVSALEPAAGAQELLSLEVVSPRLCDEIVTVAPSGWPLIFRLTTLGASTIGIGCHYEGTEFPEHEQAGYLVLEDPATTCFPEPEDALICPLAGSLEECLARPEGVHVEFTPDTDAPSLPDRAGNAARR